MAKWLFPVNPAIYDIERAFDDSHDICWAKYDFEFQIDDLIYLYVTEPIGVIRYQYKVIGLADKSELPQKDKDYWLNKEELDSYKGDYFIIRPIKKVEKATLSRRYLIEQGLITPKDTLQSHKTTKFVKGKKSEKINAHQKLLAFIGEQFNTELKNADYPDEIDTQQSSFPEGAKKTVQVNRYERNPEARAKCIEFHKARCKVCEMSFDETYGMFAKDFIHVHHIKPLSEINEEYEVDPINDLIPVCPNCHAMLHRQQNGIPMTVERLKLLYEVSRNSKI